MVRTKSFAKLLGSVRVESRSIASRHIYRDRIKLADGMSASADATKTNAP